LWCELHASSLVAVVLSEHATFAQSNVSLAASVLVHLIVNP
jgi:hypothetical protein